MASKYFRLIFIEAMLLKNVVITSEVLEQEEMFFFRLTSAIALVIRKWIVILITTRERLIFFSCVGTELSLEGLSLYTGSKNI